MTTGYERFIGKVSPRLTLISMDIERLQENIGGALAKGGMTIREYDCLKSLADMLGQTAYILSKEYENDGEHREGTERGGRGNDVHMDLQKLPCAVPQVRAHLPFMSGEGARGR